MAVWYQGKPAQVWVIGKDSPQPDWVEQAFRQQYICWMDNHIRVLMAGLQASLATNLKLGATGSAAGGGFVGYGMYQLGYEGDVLDITNHRIVSAKRFAKDYQVVED
ncbi:role in replication [Streptococcus cuniculipharyngis]|uniref:Role in replication n=1 Tax=Streptococcus cuniculipharyngis TaxID=1562651 RepID=A0A5C5SF58_9STRE|nr:role in replication [Streptococcus cuniculipharyngis]TWS98930.1 role in replication [Streptococcus cuniculipharyngis]